MSYCKVKVAKGKCGREAQQFCVTCKLISCNEHMCKEPNHRIIELSLDFPYPITKRQYALLKEIHAKAYASYLRKQIEGYNQ